MLHIDNLLKMKRQLLQRRPASHKKHKRKKQKELLLSRLPKKLQLIWL